MSLFRIPKLQTASSTQEQLNGYRSVSLLVHGSEAGGNALKVHGRYVVKEGIKAESPTEASFSRIQVMTEDHGYTFRRIRHSKCKKESE